jgi:hypothetical protein
MTGMNCELRFWLEQSSALVDQSCLAGAENSLGLRAGFTRMLYEAANTVGIRPDGQFLLYSPGYTRKAC